MATTRSALTDEDIRTLVKGATPDERALAARKLCTTMERTTLSEEDRALAADILRVMAADAAELVRKALAETLKSSAVVPRDVAVRGHAAGRDPAYNDHHAARERSHFSARRLRSARAHSSA